MKRARRKRSLTRWSDRMVLESIRDFHGLTPQARERALELAERGFIDARGTWVLTSKGRRALRLLRRD